MHPEYAYQIKLNLYGVNCAVPVLVIPGQKGELTIGANVLKHVMYQMKSSEDY